MIDRLIKCFITGLLTFSSISASAGIDPMKIPRRVVSINLCTDQMAMALSNPQQLISVSYISTDPRLSPYADQVDQYTLNHGQAEEIFAMQPDLVLVDPYSDPLVVGLLRDLGVNVVTFESAHRIEDIPTRIRAMGQILGQERRADELAVAFERGIKSLAQPSTPPARAALFGANGYSAGSQTLSGDIVAAAGLDNLAEDLGIDFGGNIALETLAINPPEFLITNPEYEGASNAEAIMSHPAIIALQDENKTKVIRSDANWACGTPRVLDAVRDLRDQTTGAPS